MDRLLGRVKGLLLAPHAEWEAISAEPGDAAGLFTRYVAILALVPALAHFIGAAIIGGYASFLSALLAAVVGYVLSVAAVFVVAWIVNRLAPTFDSQRNFGQALKLTVYSYTPVWLAGIVLLVPGLSFLTVLGLFGLYLFWLGLPPLMATPSNKSLVYAAAVVGCAVVLAVVIGVVQWTLLGGAR